MNRIFLSSRLPALALAAGYLAVATSPAAAQATDQTTAASGDQQQQPNRSSVSYFDLTAGAGYSSNPLLALRGSSSAFGRLSLSGFHAWNTETGTTYVSGYIDDTTYLSGGYGSKVIFSVNAHTDQSLNEKVRVYANLLASGDVAGQLSNRFAPEPIVNPPPTTVPPPPDVNPELFNLAGRQYRVSAQVGASIVTSARSTISLSASASRGIFTGQSKNADYSTYQGSVGYNHQLSEKSWVGVNVSLQHQDYRGDDYANVVNTAATFRTQLGQNLTADGSVGIMAIYQHRAGENDHSYSPSFSGSICKAGERSQFCVRASRDAQAPLGIGIAQGARTASITTDVSANYRRTLGPGESLQATASLTRNSSVDRLQTSNFTSTYASALLGYDRKVGNRLFAGVNVGARKLYQSGPDPRTDFSGNLYLRYRLGDLL